MMGCRSDAIITIRVSNLGYCGTRMYVLMRSSQTDTLCCDRIRLWSRCLPRSPSRIPTIWASIGPEGYINSQTDYRLHCVFQDFLRLTTIFDMSWYERRDQSTIKTTIPIVALIVIVGTPHKAELYAWYKTLIKCLVSDACLWLDPRWLN